MELCKNIKDIKAILRKEQKNGKTIGFIPTMGFLHDGHLSLIRKSKSENDITVVSIFVNPTQFGVGEDFEKYPRDLSGDMAMAQEAGASIIFAPETPEMYPLGYETYVEVTNLTQNLCGASRPGHFRGVTTVVNKLFNIVNPDRAYFGQKDAQQAFVIQKMVKDLDMDVEVIICPTVRESSGLAMSSRNSYLSKEQREQAIVLYQSLCKTSEIVAQGVKDVSVIKAGIEKMIKEKPLAQIDYIEIVDTETLGSVSESTSKLLIALAVKFGTTRLIDNMILEV